MKMSSNKDKVNVSNSGMGILGGLFLMFLWLKLNPGGNYDTPISDWSWWLVTSPLWAIPAILLAAFLAAILTMIISKILGIKNG